MQLVCGEALYDVFPQGFSEDGSLTLKAVAGGSPLNIAVGMARMGLEVALATDLALDTLGEGLAMVLRREGVSDAFLRRTAPATALAMVSIDSSGGAAYNFVGLKEATYWPEPHAVQANADRVSGIHLGSIAMVMQQSAEPLVNTALHLSGHAIVSFDPNVRLSVEPDRARWRAATERACALSHIIKVSEDDLIALFGEGIVPDAICVEWLSSPTELVILTRGSQGATIFSRQSGNITVPSFETEVVDTVGAGDSYMAAVLSKLSMTRSLSFSGLGALNAGKLEEIGLFASAAAALTCSRRGPNLPNLKEVRAFLVQSGASVMQTMEYS
jgi:fructokinase